MYNVFSLDSYATALWLGCHCRTNPKNVFTDQFGRLLRRKLGNIQMQIIRMLIKAKHILLATKPLHQLRIRQLVMLLSIRRNEPLHVNLQTARQDNRNQGSIALLCQHSILLADSATNIIIALKIRENVGSSKGGHLGRQCSEDGAADAFAKGLVAWLGAVEDRISRVDEEVIVDEFGGGELICEMTRNGQLADAWESIQVDNGTDGAGLDWFRHAARILVCCYDVVFGVTTIFLGRRVLVVTIEKIMLTW